jgi:D-glycero-alpha-D-manno-heptose 1-phosphate guanylyltransferase
MRATATSEPKADQALPPVVILAGGFGTRLKSVLPGIPKPMAPVAGRPFVEWVVRFFARHGAVEFILSTGYLAGQIEAHFSTQPVPGVRVRCCPETTPLGTAGGFLNCLDDAPAPDGIWIVTNGDSLVFADPHPLLAALREGGAEGGVLGLAMDDASRYGTLEYDHADRLTAFREKRPGRGVVNSGVYVLTGAALRGLPAQRPLSFESDVFPRLAARGQVAVARTVAAFLDIGTPASLVEAEQFILQHQSEFLP